MHGGQRRDGIAPDLCRLKSAKQVRVEKIDAARSIFRQQGAFRQAQHLAVAVNVQYGLAVRKMAVAAGLAQHQIRRGEMVGVAVGHDEIPYLRKIQPEFHDIAKHVRGKIDQ